MIKDYCHDLLGPKEDRQTQNFEKKVDLERENLHDYEELFNLLTVSNNAVDENAVNLLYENENLIAVYKPCNKSSTDRTFLQEMRIVMTGLNVPRVSCDALFPSFRLPKEQSGIVVYAKNETYHNKFIKLLSKYQSEKTQWQSFVALCNGFPDLASNSRQLNITRQRFDEQILSVPVDKATNTMSKKGKVRHSQTFHNMLGYSEKHQVSLVHLTTNNLSWDSLRCHMLLEKCPIIGDQKYGDHMKVIAGEKFLLPFGEKAKHKQELKVPKSLVDSNMLHLHRYKLFIQDQAKLITLQSSLPRHFRNILKHMKLFLK